MLFQILLLMVASATIALAAKIDHDAVNPFKETVPPTSEGDLMNWYKPYLDPTDGCVPYPVVDVDGNIGGGLKPTSAPSDGCDESIGQVYARSTTIQGHFSIMYSWQMPKNFAYYGKGRRYAFPNAVLFFDSSERNAKFLCAAVSGVKKYNNGYPEMDKTHPLLMHCSEYTFGQYSLAFAPADDIGAEQPLITWEGLTEAARTALNTFNFGKSKVPFKDGEFEENVKKSHISCFGK